MPDFISTAPNGCSARARRPILFGSELTEQQVDGALRLKAVYYEGVGARVDGFLHDYALAAEAFLAIASKIDCAGVGRIGHLSGARAGLCG